MRTRFYKNMVFYQIWPRSFKDGNNDGIGDLYGVLEKLDYIKSLNVDGIWFSPLYPSPNVDFGYDVSNYCDIDPAYGDLDTFKEVLSKCHSLGLKVIMDLVINHTSIEHEWFQKSRKKIQPYTDYYIWRPPVINKKGEKKAPNNWDSNFLGKAWEYDEVRQEYYLHLFTKEQPDLNMDNPVVRIEVKKIMKFWLDLGVDGFREDVITFISKNPKLPNDYLFPMSKGFRFYNNGPKLKDYLSEFYTDVLSQYDPVIIAEAPLLSPRKALKYIKETDDNPLDMVINMDYMGADCIISDLLPTRFHLGKLKRAFTRWQNGVNKKGWNLLFLENHDHPRSINRYADPFYHNQSAKMLLCSYIFQMGTPFIYMGQEIGMTNFKANSIDDFVDCKTLNSKKNKSLKKRLKYYEKTSRDHARTPMQWDRSDNAGFSSTTPWFHINSNYKEINVENQERNDGSVLNFYRKAIKLRKELPVVLNGKYKEIKKLSPRIYAYTRNDGEHKLLVICSFSKYKTKFKSIKGYNLNQGKLILANYSINETFKNSFIARPYELRVYLF